MDLMSFLLKCSLIKFNVDVDEFDSVISEYFLLNFIPESFLRVQLWRVRGRILQGSRVTAAMISDSVHKKQDQFLVTFLLQGLQTTLEAFGVK
jgi:hypothetical protein